jgi:hypothetical protein
MSPRGHAATSACFFRAVFDARRLRLVFFAGTLAPFRRASERPMAMACLRLVTSCPEPERSVPPVFPRGHLLYSASPDRAAFEPRTFREGSFAAAR